MSGLSFMSNQYNRFGFGVEELGVKVDFCLHCTAHLGVWHSCTYLSLNCARFRALTRSLMSLRAGRLHLDMGIEIIFTLNMHFSRRLCAKRLPVL